MLIGKENLKLLLKHTPPGPDGVLTLHGPWPIEYVVDLLKQGVSVRIIEERGI